MVSDLQKCRQEHWRSRTGWSRWSQESERSTSIFVACSCQLFFELGMIGFGVGMNRSPAIGEDEVPELGANVIDGEFARERVVPIEDLLNEVVAHLLSVVAELSLAGDDDQRVVLRRSHVERVQM